MVSRAGKKGAGKSKTKPAAKKGAGRTKREEQAEEQTRIALEKYRILFESFPLGITITDAEGNIVEANRESERLLGIRRNEQLQRRYDGPEWTIVRPDGTPMPSDEYASVRALKENRRIENVEMGIVKNGKEITWINVTAEPIPLENFGVAITYGDISARRKLEENLEKQRREFKHIIDSAPIIIFYKDLAGRMIRVNKTFSEALNLPEGEILGKTVFDVYSAPIAQAMTDDDQEVLRTGCPKLNIEEPYESATDIRWVRTDKVPIIDDNGRPIGLVGFAQDITKRKMAEKALMESEERFRTSAQNMMDAFGIYTAIRNQSGQIVDFKIEFVNTAACLANGMSKEDQLGKRLCELLPSHLETGLFDQYCHVVETGEPLSIESQIYEDVYGEKRIARVFDINAVKLGDGFAASWRDVTERTRMEQALQESEKRVRTKLDAILAPQGDIGKLELADILDIDAIQSIMDDFHRLTNISAWILDLEGKILVSTGWRDICTRFHRVNPETCTNCVESDTQLSEGVAPGTFKIYKCKNNMWDLVTPIAVGNKHIGNLFLGQFLFDDEAVDDALFRSQARRYGFNEEEYLAALERVPRLSRQTLDSAMAFYSKFAHMISTLSHSNIQLARSLTEKNNLLSALQASETQYRLLAEHITDAVVLLDMNLKSTYLSPSVERARGFTAQEIKQIPLDKQMTPESFKIVSDLLMKELPKMEADPNYNPVHTLELELYRKDGSTLWAENKLSVIRDENGKAISILAESRDITDRKLAQIALVESEEKYRSLFHRAPIGIAVTTTDGIVIEINNAQAKMMGYEVEELRGKNAVDYYVNPDKRLEINKAVQKAGKLHDFEIELIRKDGSILTELLNFDQLQLGVSDFILVTGRDVTKLRQAEKAVRESEARYRLLAEHTTDTVGLMDKDLNTIYVSPSSEKLRGYTVQEIMEMPLDKHITNESLQLAADAIMKELPRVQADPDYNPVLSLELEYNRKDGTTLWMENKFSVIRDHSGNFMNILTEARDITERREYEKKLESTLAALEKTLRDTVIAISRIVEMKDPFTAGHQIRVAQLASSMARKMNLSDEEAAVLNTAATIHDIGKIYVPSDILSKPGKLNPLEYEIIQTHVRGSYEILKDIDFNGPIAQIVHQHHERMDGSGYPLGLKGPEILPLARILIVADVVEAMSSHRPYRAAMGVEKALDEITRNRGKLYDEAAVDACLDLFNNDRFRFSPVESSRIV